MEPRIYDGIQNRIESWTPPSLGGWPVRPRVKRISRRRQKNAEGPTARTCEHLDCLHVDVVEIWTLFSVYFDGNKMVIQNFGNRCVFEAFMGHNVAPMAGRIPYGEKYRFVSTPGGLECLVAPGVPIHWVGLVLEQVWAGRIRESVRHGSLYYPESLFAKG